MIDVYQWLWSTGPLGQLGYNEARHHNEVSFGVVLLLCVQARTLDLEARNLEVSQLQLQVEEARGLLKKRWVRLRLWL